MKKGSVLIQRAALLTTLSVILSAVVTLAAFGLLNGWQTGFAVRKQLLPQAERLVAAAAEDAAVSSARLTGEAGMFALSGGSAWYIDADRRVTCLTGDAALPTALSAGIDRVMTGETRSGRTRGIGASPYVLLPVRRGGVVAGAIVATLPLRGGWSRLGLAALCALLGGCAAALASRPLQKRLLEPVVAPLGKLRDTAVAISKGHLDQRANEHAPGEVGELGQAVNHISSELSRSMYTLIIERNRLKNILNGLSEGIVAIDSSGAITHTNPALERFFTKRRLTLQLPDARMKFIPDQSIWEDFDKVIATGEGISRTMNSKDMVLHISISPIVDEINSIAGAVGLISDITQQERLERTRREYVSNVSHELRTPLTAIRALVEPLNDGLVTDPERVKHYYGIIIQEIMRLSRLIEDQLTLSRLQSGAFVIEKQRLSLDDLVYDVCDRYRAIAAEKGLEIVIGTDFGACPAVWSNADKLEQMLVILIDNAIKYTEKGTVTVSADWDDARVVLHVRDTGVGIRETDLPYVFDRFYKVDKAHTEKGSGLGLSIARELLRHMGEDIWVTSEIGVGTEFSFTVHRNPPADEAPDGAEAATRA